MPLISLALTSSADTTREPMLHSLSNVLGVTAGRLHGLLGCLTLKPLSYPELDDGLAADSQVSGLTVEGLDHPRGEVDVDASRLLSGSASAGQVEISAQR